MNVKTILCFGDSLTWGSDPETGGRHPETGRWPEVLAAGLGNAARVVTDGLRGRTTGYDEHLADCDRNGVRLLPTVLYTHAPVDIVVIMLGCNDMKPHICGTALGAMQGMRRLTQIALRHTQGTTPAMTPKVLLVAPPPLVETNDPEFAAMFEGGVPESQKLGGLYQKLADEMGVEFFDAGTVARTSPVDGVHLDEANTRAIGKALVPIVKQML